MELFCCHISLSLKHSVCNVSTFRSLHDWNTIALPEQCLLFTPHQLRACVGLTVWPTIRSFTRLRLLPLPVEKISSWPIWMSEHISTKTLAAQYGHHSCIPHSPCLTVLLLERDGANLACSNSGLLCLTSPRNFVNTEFAWNDLWYAIYPRTSMA